MHVQCNFEGRPNKWDRERLVVPLTQSRLCCSDLDSSALALGRRLASTTNPLPVLRCLPAGGPCHSVRDSVAGLVLVPVCASHARWFVCIVLLSPQPGAPAGEAVKGRLHHAQAAAGRAPRHRPGARQELHRHARGGASASSRVGSPANRRDGLPDWFEILPCAPPRSGRRFVCMHVRGT